MTITRVLFLAANPSDKCRLALEREVKEIERRIRGAGYRESLQFNAKWAVTPDDVIEYLNQFRPHIVQFSMHGTSDNEILLEDENGDTRPVAVDAMKSLFAAMTDEIRVVLFNSCHGRAFAESVVEVIDCAIGMDGEVADDAAIVFSSSFYRAIAYGRSIHEAFNQGRLAIGFDGMRQEHAPKLFVRESQDASKITLAKRQSANSAPGPGNSISIQGDATANVIAAGHGVIVGASAPPIHQEQPDFGEELDNDKGDIEVEINGDVKHSNVQVGPQNSIWNVKIQSVARAWVVTIAVLLVIGVGIGAYIVRQQEKTGSEIETLLEDPDVVAAQLKRHIRESAQEQISAARSEQQSWRIVANVKAERDAQLQRVEKVIKAIQEGLDGKPDPVFATAIQILEKSGVEEAVQFLETERPRILKDAESINTGQVFDESAKREKLRSILFEANLREVGLKRDEAESLYRDVAGKATSWWLPRFHVGRLLRSRGSFDDSKDFLQSAVALAESDAERITTKTSLGLLYLDTAKWNRAEELLSDVLRLSQSHYGFDHPETATAFNNLARVYQETSRLEEAEKHFRSALAIDEQELVAGHPDIARDLSNLGSLLRTMDRLDEAERMVRRALSIDQEHFGSQHEITAIRLSSLADILVERNQNAKAEELIRKALAIDERVFGNDHPRVAIRMNNLAGVLMRTGREAEAEAYLRRSLEIDEKAYGPDHPMIATRLDNLGEVLRNAGRLSTAELLKRRAVAIDEESYRRGHMAVAERYANLASILLETNRSKLAEPLMRRSLEIDEANLGKDHPDVGRDLNNLAQLLIDTGRHGAAEPLMRRALLIYEENRGADDPRVARLLANLGGQLMLTTRYTEAETLLRAALAIHEELGHSHRRDISSDLSNLATLFVDTGRFREAEVLLCHALAIDEVVSGSDSTDVALRLANLAQVLVRTDRPHAAVLLAQRALKIDLRARNIGHARVVVGLNNLAGILKQVGHSEYATVLFRHCLTLDEQNRGFRHPSVALRLINIAHALQGLNRLKDAENVLSRSLQILQTFRNSTGYQHPEMESALSNHRFLLDKMGLSEDEIRRRAGVVLSTEAPDRPASPEIDKIFGELPQLDDVLFSLNDIGGKAEEQAFNLPSISDPLTPELVKIIVPTRVTLQIQGAYEFSRKDYARAAVVWKRADELYGNGDNWSLMNRKNYAAALRRLGAYRLAQEEFQALLPEIELDGESTSVMIGRVQYALAYCEWHLGHSSAAMDLVTSSLSKFQTSSSTESVPPQFVEESNSLLQDLQTGRQAPSSSDDDFNDEIGAARRWLKGTSVMKQLDRSRKLTPELNIWLGSQRALGDVFGSLDQSYKEEGRPEVFYLPAHKPIAAHLDELIGLAGSVQSVLRILDEQYRDDAKPPIWFLPLNKPISADLDMLLGPSKELERLRNLSGMQ